MLTAVQGRCGGFLSYYPLKQGLKQRNIYKNLTCCPSFLSYYPLKQGLKPEANHDKGAIMDIFILLSIKTRIETKIWQDCTGRIMTIFILLSIKTRIET